MLKHGTHLLPGDAGEPLEKIIHLRVRLNVLEERRYGYASSAEQPGTAVPLRVLLNGGAGRPIDHSGNIARANLTPRPNPVGSITVPLWSQNMPTLTIKGLPDLIYERLKAQADVNRRSLNGEIIVCLERSVRATRFDSSAWLAEARAFREGLDLEPLTERELRAARQAGRA
jgi:antitoxin FitA